MIISGGALFGFYSYLGYRGTFLAMAALTALSSLPVLGTPEPVPAPQQAKQPGIHFLRLHGVWRIIALLVIYKAGESFAQGMLRPFLVDTGLHEGDLALMVGIVGAFSGMAGALVGGLLVTRLGRRRSLVAFGIGQVITVAGYAYLSLTSPSMTELYTWTGVEHFASGMATAALFTCMMDWSRPASSGTDYTVQASAVVIAQGGAAALSGFSAHALGYPLHFALATALCAIAVVLARFLYREHL